ncbi:hypothetical protein CDL12_25644 [Handroanthus impetiginosus]|uniref:Uncharacterized protein n=1 Tax=Handroanthus impetiginosus TaxID=429701 RepID=A0A2G9G975_9LAMI|nr:hypothetical protein CDL12_25644 [Handroanthus impetiginosus]
MDKIEPSKELIEDLTREQLIAISYRVPDANQNTDQTPEISPKYINGEVVEPLISDGKEKYRSELISISYLPSPDAVVLPPSPGQLNG